MTAGGPQNLAPLGLAFAAGVGAVFLLPRTPSPWAVSVLAVAALGLPWLARPRLARPLAAAALGALWALLQAFELLWSPFPEELARAPLIIEGRIASIPTDTGFAQRFLFRVERTQVEDRAAGPKDAGFRGLVRLSWYGGPGELKAGERWRLPVRLKPPHGFANPGGFDFERWLFEQGVAATGNLRKGVEPQRLDPGPGGQWLSRARQSLAGHLAGVLGDHPALPLVQALTIGERSGFEPGDWEVLTRTGTNHLVAISGLHVGLIAAAAFFLIRRLWALSPRLARAIAAPRAGALGALAAALVYAALAGFAVSTQRALIMLAVVLGALFWQRTLRPWHAFSLALAGVLLVDPGAVLSYGAWLSFGAVAVLLFSLGGRLPTRDLWTRWGRAQWAVALGLLPLLFALFNRASLISPVVNLVAVPLFSLVLLPLVLVTSLLSLVPGLGLPLVWTADLLAWCLTGLERVAAWPWAAASLSERPLWVWGAAAAGTTLLLAPRGLPGRWLGLALALPVLLLRPEIPGPGEAWLSLLDVGQGLSAVVRTRDGTLVYDTGPGFDSGFNTGAVVVAPFLQSRGVDRVDVLVLSHADRDHTGGAQGLMGRLPVGRILGGEPTILGLPGAEPCRAGQGWDWAGVRFRFLHPGESPEEGNDASCVLRVEAGGRSILLPGDIGRVAETRLVREQPQALASDVLVAGHHGSATSTGAPFLEAVAPSLVLYSAGYANPFGFPAREVRKRVAARGIRALNTGVSGAVELRLAADGSIAGPWTWRERAGRLWSHRVPE
ncbi:MAG: DNA internalization-related competence protein ComEC/Rec2 [Bdellovibrio bacteriovorus]